MTRIITKAECYILLSLFSANMGWFNLNAPGAVTRSVGWHQFTIIREPDNTTIDFYVDNVFGRQITGARAATWDSVTLGVVQAVPCAPPGLTAFRSPILLARRT